MDKKIVLVGYPGSQHIVPASKYLVNKYLPGYEAIYLNYTGAIEGWSKFVADYLKGLDDEKVIFALDDYFISGADLDKLKVAWKWGDWVKLCETTEQEHEQYPVTTQYTIWTRELLIHILESTTTPWNFEMTGGKYINFTPDVYTCIYYDVHSALSNRWEGIHLDGLKHEDINYLINNKLV
jgi:hypothetical protein